MPLRSLCIFSCLCLFVCLCLLPVFLSVIPASLILSSLEFMTLSLRTRSVLFKDKVRSRRVSPDIAPGRLIRRPVRFGHSGKCVGPPPALPFPTSPDAGFGGTPLCVDALSRRKHAPPSSVAPESFVAALAPAHRLPVRRPTYSDYVAPEPGKQGQIRDGFAQRIVPCFGVRCQLIAMR